MICRGGRGSGASGGGSIFNNNIKFVIEEIKETTEWVVPENVVNNEFSVRIFGGGGGGCTVRLNKGAGYGGGGGSGWMNNDILKLTSGSVIQITIGSYGQSELVSYWSSVSNAGSRQSGGTTSFGTYLSANGGSAATIVANRSNGTYLARGGNGGSGGGGSGGAGGDGGIGYQFGGGGGWNGGSGGVYGGGGGGSNYSAGPRGGNGGIYGGKGGGLAYDYNTDGTNTMGLTTEINVYNNQYIRGQGKAFFDVTFKHWYGGGGYGGSCLRAMGGGGGFGGNGGDSIEPSGGGGYGCDGGEGYGENSGFISGNRYTYGGGGGGYLFSYNTYGGGIGFGEYGSGGGATYDETYITANNRSGHPGICIIQYYTKE